MADSKAQYQKLPPGWDCKYDSATGNCYYINYFTKAMQLEDPRIRYKQLQNERCSTESIPMQPVHCSPYHVYPSNNLPAMRAFQAVPATNTSLHNMSSSPLLSSRLNLEMSPLPMPRTSQTATPRLGNMSRRSTIQETSFTNPNDTDAVVTKIQNMFPTASSDHIRLLLKKYYNREAVVISALQVEKHPVTMPGPFVTPPAQRHLFHSNSAFHMTPPARRLDMGATGRAQQVYGGGSAVASCLGSSTSRTASPIPGGRFGSVISMHSASAGGSGGSNSGYVAVAGGAAMPFYHGSPRFDDHQWRSSPKPHSSPKMKLRYMKNIFPKADEMLLLDILASADNNVQKASEELIAMGYAKREVIPPKTAHRVDTEASANATPKRPGDETIIPLRPKEYTQEEKESTQAHLKEKYPQIAERIILMALESVNYAEDRAMQILHIVQEEDELHAKKHDTTLTTTIEQDENIVPSGSGARSATVGDSNITVVLETATNSGNNSGHQTILLGTQAHSSSETPSTSSALSGSRKTASAAKKVTFPSINVTTPSTATTQIILSNSPICTESDAAPPSITTKASSICGHQTQPTTTKDIVDTSNKSHFKDSTSSSPPSLPLPLKPPPPPPSTSTSSSIPSSPTFQSITTKSILARCNSNAATVHGYSHGNNFSCSSTTSASAHILDNFKEPRPRDKSNSLKNVPQRDSIEEDDNAVQRQEYQSIVERITALGHNAELSKGADESLLLADYITWNGANPHITTGQRHPAVGQDASKLSERSYTPHGRNPDLCKGSNASLAKGSIYTQLAAVRNAKSANIKCN